MGRFLCQVFTLVSTGLINQTGDRSNRLPEPRRAVGGGGGGLRKGGRTRVQLTRGCVQPSYKRRDAGVFIHVMLLSNLSGGDPSWCYQKKQKKEKTTKSEHE